MRETMSCWRRLIEYSMKLHGETFEDIVGHAPDTKSWMDVPFDDGYGSQQGCPFTLWTKNRVYFPLCYDGSEWVGSAPRNPCDEEMGHQGGG